MNIVIKTEEDIVKIKQAIQIWQKVKSVLIAHCQPGVTLEFLDNLAKQTIESYNAIPTFYQAYGYSKNICISVNDCVIHGVPDNYIIREQDLITFDVGVTYLNHVCDAAFSVVVGNNLAAEKIKAVCENSLKLVKNIIKPGVTNLEIARFIQDYVTSHGYYVLRDFTGHGCGNKMHEDPPFPNYVSSIFPVIKLKENMVFCLEPMIMTGSDKYYISDNGWNVMASNGQLTCHCEDMFLVTSNGCIVLTNQEDKIEHN